MVRHDEEVERTGELRALAGGGRHLVAAREPVRILGPERASGRAGIDGDGRVQMGVAPEDPGRIVAPGIRGVPGLADGRVDLLPARWLLLGDADASQCEDDDDRERPSARGHRSECHSQPAVGSAEPERRAVAVAPGVVEAQRATAGGHERPRREDGSTCEVCPRVLMVAKFPGIHA
jgi:hypothetical protein